MESRKNFGNRGKSALDPGYTRAARPVCDITCNSSSPGLSTPVQDRAVRCQWPVTRGWPEGPDSTCKSWTGTHVVRQGHERFRRSVQRGSAGHSLHSVRFGTVGFSDNAVASPLDLVHPTPFKNSYATPRCRQVWKLALPTNVDHVSAYFAHSLKSVIGNEQPVETNGISSGTMEIAACEEPVPLRLRAVPTWRR
jgi:hypothetical protein